MFLKSVIGTKVYAVKEITLPGAGAGPQATHKRSGGQTQPEMQRAAFARNAKSCPKTQPESCFYRRTDEGRNQDTGGILTQPRPQEDSC